MLVRVSVTLVEKPLFVLVVRVPAWKPLLTTVLTSCLRQRGSQDKCIMEMIVEGSGMCNKDLTIFTRPHKRQRAIFLSDIPTAKGDKINKLLMSD